MSLWKRIFISLILVFSSLAILQLTISLKIPEATTGYFVMVTSSIAIFLIAIAIILIALTQFFPKKPEERRKEDERKVEELFTYEFLHSASTDKIPELVENYKNRSTLAKTRSDPKVDVISLANKILDSYTQRKVRNSVGSFLSSGKGYQALGVIIKHLIEHHKIPTYQANFLERELKHLMPKRDIIGLYERE